MDDEDDVLLSIAENIGDSLSVTPSALIPPPFHSLSSPQRRSGILSGDLNFIFFSLSRSSYSLLWKKALSVMRSVLSFLPYLPYLSQAVKAVALIVDGLPDADLQTHFVPFLTGLAQKDW
jgi:hypothetical protein